MTNRRSHVLISVGIAVAIAGAGLAAPARAAANRTVALWNMDEPPGATQLVDSSGNGLHGTIGTDVESGHEYDGAIGHRFSFVLPNQPPANPQRLDTVPHDDRLNPGTRDFAVTVRIWTKQNFGNIVQKGQSGAAGGYWKFEQPKGRVTCLFRGSQDSVAVKSDVLVNDQKWHTIRCERDARGLTMTIDGVHVTRRSAQPGNIANNRPITIAGKGNCNQDTITCDYFVGRIDYVKIESS
jgi:tellurite resistance-related uncharacterized protein